MAPRHDAPIVTVFGGTGFLGRYVVWRLAKLGYVVRVPTRDPNRVLPLKTDGTVAQVVALPTNIHDASSVEKTIQGADYVINLIGTLYEKSKRQTFQKIHADFPALLGSLAAKNNIKQMVHVSALGADLHATSRYARSKAQGENALRQAFPKAVIIRPSILFGDEDTFLNKFARLARFLPILPLIGGGRTRFQPVYVGDVADATLRVLTDPDAQGKTYSLGGPRVYSFEELLIFLENITGQKRILFAVPFEVMKIKAWFWEKLPRPIISRDQIESLKTDNILPPNSLGFSALGIAPSSLEAIAPHYLNRYRTGGRFAAKST